jgi:hypothetical protein
MKRILLCTVFLISTANAFGLDEVNQNEKITYDNNNYLFFEDVGRNTLYDNGRVISLTYGKFVRLHVHRDSKQYDVDLVDTQYDPSDSEYPVVAPRVVAIKYADKDNVWLVNQSHIGQGCTLYNIVEKKVVKEYGGLQVEISPDGNKVAIVTRYFRESTGRRTDYFVFVNDTMVFPYVEPGFTVWKWGGGSRLEDRIRKADGTNVADFLSKKHFTAAHLVPQIEWKDKDTVIFHVKDDAKDTTATRYLVSGLSNIETSHTQNIRVLKAGVDMIE